MLNTTKFEVIRAVLFICKINIYLYSCMFLIVNFSEAQDSNELQAIEEIRRNGGAVSLNKFGDAYSISFTGCKNIDFNNINNIKYLKSLKHLQLKDSNVGSNFINTVTKFLNIETIDISGTKLKDSEIARLADLRSLTRILCDDTDIKNDSFLAIIQNNRNIFDISANRTKLNKGFTKSLELLADLRFFSFSGNANAISSSDLEQLSKLPSIEVLDLSNNNLSDIDVIKLLTSKSLIELTLANNNIGDIAIQLLTKIKKLESINISNTRISSPGLQNLFELTNLRNLDVSKTRIDDTGLLNISKCTNLKNINVSHTFVTNKGMEFINNLTNINLLDLSFNRINDTGIISLNVNLPIKTLILSGTEISDFGIIHISKFNTITHLELSSTEISDRSALSIMKMEGISFLSVEHTKISAAVMEMISKKIFLIKSGEIEIPAQFR